MCIIYVYILGLYFLFFQYFLFFPLLRFYIYPVVYCCMFLKADSHDLIIFKFFRVIFFLKKKTIEFPLSFNLYFQQKRVPKFSICHLQPKRSVGVFDVTNRTNSFSIFQSYHEVVISLTH